MFPYFRGYANKICTAALFIILHRKDIPRQKLPRNNCLPVLVHNIGRARVSKPQYLLFLNTVHLESLCLCINALENSRGLLLPPHQSIRGRGRSLRYLPARGLRFRAVCSNTKSSDRQYHDRCQKHDKQNRPFRRSACMRLFQFPVSYVHLITSPPFFNDFLLIVT